MRFFTVHTIGAFAFIMLGAASLPGILSAQSQSALLREQIRIELQSDDRAASLSDTELQNVVEMLAQRIEEAQQTDAFVGPDVFYEEMVPYPNPEGYWLFSRTGLYGIIVLALGLALLGLWHIHRPHGVQVRL
jgi:hypothetical protein